MENKFTITRFSSNFTVNFVLSSNPSTCLRIGNEEIMKLYNDNIGSISSLHTLKQST